MRILFLTVILSISSFAASQRIYKFGDLMISFEEVDGVIVNGSCEDKKCEAFKKAKMFSGKSVSPKLLEGGKNPASVKCKTMMEGRVVFGVDMEGHEQSFCVFKDDSYLL
jgi:hypothetical protein